MSEYISRESVLKIAHEIAECRFEPDKIFLYEGYLRRIPSADVAPVVRCMDCRFYGVKQSKLCDMHNRAANDSDYCSYGVHRADIEAART